MANQIPPYKEVDMQSISVETQDLTRDIGAKDAADVVAKMNTLDKYGKYIETSRIVRDVMDTKYQHDLNYQRDTDMLAQMNESWNANRYIDNVLDREHRRVRGLDKSAKRDLYRLRHSYQRTTWHTKYYSFVMGIIVFTLYVTFMLLMLAALWRSDYLSTWWLVVLGGVILVIYTTILVILFKNTAMRRSTNWHQYHWKTSKEIIDATKNNNAGQCEVGGYM